MDFEEFSKKFDLIYKKKDDEDSSELVESKTNNLQISSNILKEDKEIADLIGKDSDWIRHYIPQNLPSYTINIYTQNGEEIKQTSMKILKECKLHNQVQAEDRNISNLLYMLSNFGLIIIHKLYRFILFHQQFVIIMT